MENNFKEYVRMRGVQELKKIEMPVSVVEKPALQICRDLRMFHLN